MIIIMYYTSGRSLDVDYDNNVRYYHLTASIHVNSKYYFFTMIESLPELKGLHARARKCFFLKSLYYVYYGDW